MMFPFSDFCPKFEASTRYIMPKECLHLSSRIFSIALYVGLAFVLPPSAIRAWQSPLPQNSKPEQTTTAKADGAAKTTLAPGTDAPAPVFTEYKGVSIGTSADEVRHKFGHVKEKSDQQDFFVFSETLSAQVYYDEKGKVNALSINYTDPREAPKPVEVLGKEITPNADGSAYELVRYPEAGYWVAYSRTKGDTPLVTVTMQKLN
jgi:hypothetical protein